MFSQTVEYALQAVVHLADHAPSPRTTDQIAPATLVPKAYLSKVLHGLCHSRNVRNPMIAWLRFVLLGEAVLAAVLPLLVWFVLALIVNTVYIPLAEEPGLVKGFGDDSAGEGVSPVKARPGDGDSMLGQQDSQQKRGVLDPLDRVRLSIGQVEELPGFEDLRLPEGRESHPTL